MTYALTLNELRDELPVLARCAYLNTGTAGPTPRGVAATMAAEAARELLRGRSDVSDFRRIIACREAVRAAVARLLGASPDEIALTHHSSEAINIVLGAIDWRPGDVILTTALEHDAIAVPLGLLRRRHGVELRFVDVGHGEGALAALGAALDGRTRLLALSHVLYGTGALLPLAEICAAAHAAGALVLADGAQTCGVQPLDVRALGADFYTVSGQKWLCGPEGTGALFVAAEQVSRLAPTQGSYFTARAHDFLGDVRLHDNAQRFEMAMIHRPSLEGFRAALEWILDDVGVARAWDRSTSLARRCREGLERVDGVALITPAAQQAQLVAFDLPAFSPAQLHSLALLLAREEGLLCRSIDHPPYALRASCGFFNTEDEIDRFVAAIAQRVAEGPADVPLLGRAASLPERREA